MKTVYLIYIKSNNHKVLRINYNKIQYHIYVYCYCCTTNIVLKHLIKSANINNATTIKYSSKYSK